MSIRSSLFALGLAGGLLLAVVPATASAHCDTLDGPVVLDARTALDRGELDPVLEWIRAEDEHEIQAACGVCTDIAPEVFIMGEDAAEVTTEDVPPEHEQGVREAAESCPTEAIVIEE